MKELGDLKNNTKAVRIDEQVTKEVGAAVEGEEIIQVLLERAKLMLNACRHRQSGSNDYGMLL